MAKKNEIYIYGKHATMEALEHTPRAVKKLFLAAHIQDQALKDAARKAGVSIGLLKEKREDVNHQGVIALVSLDELIIPYKTFRESLKAEPDTALALLDEIEDPHNVGAIIRSAAGFGLSAVLIPEHNQAPITGAVAKVSAGMVFRMPIVSVGNINNTLEDLKKRGFWIYGLAGEGKQDVFAEDFEKASVFVLGNESTGIRMKTKETCDILLSIPLDPRCESLNVAASAAVAFAEWRRNKI